MTCNVIKCINLNCRRNISGKKFFEGLKGNKVQLCPHLYKLVIKKRVDTNMKIQSLSTRK